MPYYVILFSDPITSYPLKLAIIAKEVNLSGQQDCIFNYRLSFLFRNRQGKAKYTVNVSQKLKDKQHIISVKYYFFKQPIHLFISISLSALHLAIEKT